MIRRTDALDALNEKEKAVCPRCVSAFVCQQEAYQGEGNISLQTGVIGHLDEKARPLIAHQIGILQRRATSPAYHGNAEKAIVATRGDNIAPISRCVQWQLGLSPSGSTTSLPSPSTSSRYAHRRAAAQALQHALQMLWPCDRVVAAVI